jgi:hypothetical protein
MRKLCKDSTADRITWYAIATTVLIIVVAILTG